MHRLTGCGIWSWPAPGANGWHEKSDRPPHHRYVERLNIRNEYLISSHHPLRPTLRFGADRATGSTKRGQTAAEPVVSSGSRKTSIGLRQHVGKPSTASADHTDDGAHGVCRGCTPPTQEVPRRESVSVLESVPQNLTSGVEHERRRIVPRHVVGESLKILVGLWHLVRIT